MSLTDFYELLRRSDARAARSTVLSPLGWLLALELAGLLAVLRFGPGPAWLLPATGIAIALTVTLYLLAFCYFAIKNPDLLRSERYSIHKMEIEHGLRGDSAKGLVDADETRVVDVPRPNLLPHETSE